jgi:di/tricarboxylate transporter
MTSPISSPQNIFAIQEMGRQGNAPSWLAWFAVALPVAFLGNLICWFLLLAVYRPSRTLKEVRRLPDSSVRVSPVIIFLFPFFLFFSICVLFFSFLHLSTAEPHAQGDPATA